MSIFQRYQARYESAREEVMSLDDYLKKRDGRQR